MFGNKDNKNGISLGAATNHARNNLVKGTVIVGNINSQNDIRIDGTVMGNVTCEAKLVIGPSGYIEGEITCQNAVVEGQIEGNIRADQKLKLGRTGSLNGKITTGSVEIELGANFNGICEIIQEDTSYATTNTASEIEETAE